MFSGVTKKVFLCFIFLSACTREETSDLRVKTPSQKEEKPIEVSVLTVKSQEIPFVIKANGKTLAADAYQAKAPSALKVQKIFVEEGSKIQAGDPLIQFDDTEMKLRLAKAQIEIREAEAALQNANYLQQNREQLIEDGKMSETEAEGLEGRITLYQLTIDRAKAEIELYDHIGDATQINSPIAGIVTKRNVTIGSDVPADQVLLEVVKLDPLPFIFSVHTDNAASLENNAEVVVHFPAFSDQEFTAQVVSIGTESRESKSTAGAVDVKVEIPNTDFSLKTDMRGEAVLKNAGKKKVFTVPQSALLKTEKSVYVFRVDGKKLRKVPVELGDPVSGQAAVEKGLNEGDTIVSLVEENLKDDLSVTTLMTSSTPPTP